MFSRFDHVMVAEMNDGQLHKLLRAEFRSKAHGFQKIAGQPFRISEILEEIHRHIDGDTIMPPPMSDLAGDRP